MNMEKINYTFTLADCTNYVRSKFQIPRLRKYLLKDLLKKTLIFALVLSLLLLVFFGSEILQVAGKYNLTIMAVE